ncbi:MAG: hypothetical protein ACOYEF_09145 [Planifilum sp.]|jgi:hypothetical protein
MASTLLGLFLKTNKKPEWISTHIKQPAFVAITTYQALHSLFKTEKEAERVRDRRSGNRVERPGSAPHPRKFLHNHFITNGFSESPAAFSTLG